MTSPAARRALAATLVAAICVVLIVVNGDRDALASEASIARVEIGDDTSPEPANGTLDAVETGTKELLTPPVADSTRSAEPARSRLTVRVKWAGRAIPLAPVRVIADGGAIVAPESARTDRRGRASFGVPASETVTVQVDERGSDVPVERAVITAPPDAGKTVVVDLGRVPSMRSNTLIVTSYPSGAPLEGARVVARRPLGGSLLGRATSDAQGRVTLPHEPGAKYAAEADGHSRREIAGPDESTGEDLPLELLAHAELHGTLAARWGSPGQRATVRLMIRTEGQSEKLLDAARADIANDGTWQLDGLEFGEGTEELRGVEIYAYAGNYWRIVAADLTIHPGDSSEVADRFADAPRLEAQLRYDEDIDWTGEFPVTLVDIESTTSTPWVASSVQADGRLILDRLPVGSWALHVGDIAKMEAGVRLATFDHVDERKREIVLEGFAPLRGRLKVEGAEFAEVARVHIRTLDQELQAACWCDEEGRFDLSPARIGEVYRLELSQRSYVDAYNGGTSAYSRGVKRPDREHTVTATGKDMVLDF